MHNLTYQYNPNDLRVGEIIGDTHRMVFLSSLLRPEGDGTYPVWIAICNDPEQYHPYVVWNVVGRPEGWYASSGDYFHDIKDAMECYIKRGGS